MRTSVKTAGVFFMKVDTNGCFLRIKKCNLKFHVKGVNMSKKIFDDLMKEAIKEIVEELHPEDIEEEELSDEMKEKITKEISESK